MACGVVGQEVGRLRLLRASEEYEELSIVSSMIRLWEGIKAVRKKQGFISTKTDLKFKKQKMDAKTDLVSARVGVCGAGWVQVLVWEGVS